jgi:RNA polymerase sigma factor (sigma-70 family)
MPSALPAVVRHLHRLAHPARGADDEQLLRLWAADRDEAAFELLVMRHGGLVLATCRRLLCHEQDAEDAFQATFLALARKAGSIAAGAALTAWLHRVALRAALAARARRREADHLAPDEVAAPEANYPVEADDLRRAIDEEVSGLPEKYRAPFILCYLEGRTTDEAAAALRCPRGTVGTRLAWARERLRGRLARRGLAVSSAALAALGAGGASAAPGPLVRALVQAAGPFAAGSNEGAGHAAALLSERVIRTMSASKMKWGLAWAVAAGLLGAVVGMGPGVFADKKVADKADKGTVEKGDKPKPKGKAAEKGEKKGKIKADLAGVVSAVSEDGKVLTVTADAEKREARLTAATKVVYNGVRQGGARPTVGYTVLVWRSPGSETDAARVVFLGPLAQKSKADLSGEITELAADGKSFTLRLAKSIKTEPEKTATVKLAKDAELTFNGVARNEAKLAVGQGASVWLAEGSKDTAARVSAHAASGGKPKNAARPSFSGTVAALGAGGKSLTLLVPGPIKNTPPKKVELKLGEAAEVVFDGVAPGAARPAVGQHLVAWLADGSADTVARARFQVLAKKAGADLLTGTVVAVSDDGKALTLELGRKNRELPGRKVELRLRAGAAVGFEGVGPGGARPTTGYTARVALTGKDTAASVTYVGPVK